jgi:hypothetical protein
LRWTYSAHRVPVEPAWYWTRRKIEVEDFPASIVVDEMVRRSIGARASTPAQNDELCRFGTVVVSALGAKRRDCPGAPGRMGFYGVTAVLPFDVSRQGCVRAHVAAPAVT